jgi:Planctomycete cytochrome C
VADTRLGLSQLTGLALLAAAALPVAVSAGSVNGAATVLESRCIGCHYPVKSRGGLDLTTRDALLKGGDRGAAIVPGNAGASLLYRLAAHTRDRIN